MTFDLSITGGLFILAIIGTIFWLTRDKKQTNSSTDHYMGHKQGDDSLSPAYHGIKSGSNAKSSRKESHRSTRRVPSHRNDEDSYASEMMFMDHTLSNSMVRSHTNGGSGYTAPTPDNSPTDTGSSFSSGDSGGGE